MLENDELVWATYLFHRFRHHEAELMATHEVRLRLSEHGMATEMRGLVIDQQGRQMSDRAALESPVAGRLLAKVGVSPYGECSGPDADVAGSSPSS